MITPHGERDPLQRAAAAGGRAATLAAIRVELAQRVVAAIAALSQTIDRVAPAASWTVSTTDLATALRVLDALRDASAHPPEQVEIRS